LSKRLRICGTFLEQIATPIEVKEMREREGEGGRGTEGGREEGREE